MQRRRLLEIAAGGIGGSAWLGEDSVRASAVGERSIRAQLGAPDDFVPAKHGFGFANWSGDTGEDADGEEFTYEPSDVSLEDVRRALDDSWTTALSEAEKSLMTRIVYSWIGGGAATNGHCYGMVYAADGYFRNPSELPAGADAASEISRPTDTYEAVGDRIRRIQTSQLLYAELTWYALFGLRWGLADHRESLERLTETIDATGTAGIVLEGEAGAHQVLGHDYERSDGVTDVFVYDPNYEAADYEDGDDSWTLSVALDSGEVQDIKDGYDGFLYHDPELDRTVTDRLIGGPDRVLEKLSNAVFLGLETGGVLDIDVPEEVLVDRPTAEYADPERAPYADAAVVFGPPDEFEISIEGADVDEYSLEALGLRDGSLVLEESLSGTLAAVPVRLRFTINEAGEFVVNAVEDGTEAAEEGTREAVNQTEEAVNQTEEAAEQTEEAAEEAENATGETVEENLEGSNDRTGWLEDNWWIAAAGGGGALGLGAAYRHLARRSDEEDN